MKPVTVSDADIKGGHFECGQPPSRTRVRIPLLWQSCWNGLRAGSPRQIISATFFQNASEKTILCGDATHLRGKCPRKHWDFCLCMNEVRDKPLHQHG
jgi:hypothetical protein